MDAVALVGAPAAVPVTQAPEKRGPSASASGRGCSTSQLVQLLMDVWLPKIRKELCRGIINYAADHPEDEKAPRFIRDEKPIPKGDNVEGKHSPISLDVKCDAVEIVTVSQLRMDMEKWKDFEWPDIQHMETGDDGSDATMVCIDLLDTTIGLRFAEKCELQFQLGSGFMFEIGSGGSVDKCSLIVHVPRLRVWFDNQSTQIAHNGTANIAFMETPRVKPNLHMNLDVPGGMEINFDVKESGIFDELIEYVLTGFGPCSPESAVDNWLLHQLGRTTVAALGTFAKLGGGRPYTLSLKTKAADVRNNIAKLEALEKQLATLEEAEAAKEEGVLGSGEETKDDTDGDAEVSLPDVSAVLTDGDK